MDVDLSDFPFKLAAIDLDDTLLGPDGQISSANKIAVQKLRNAGVKVIIASGRRHDGCVLFQKQLGLDGPIVSFQGALVKDFVTDEIFRIESVEKECAKNVIARAEEFGATVVYYHHNAIYTKTRNEWIERHESMAGHKLTLVNSWDELSDFTPLKLLTYDHPERIKEFQNNLDAEILEKLYVLSLYPHVTEYLSPFANKAIGVQTVANMWGIKREQTVCFGDGENDIPMLSWAGLGVAVSHADPRAKAVADLHSPPGDPATCFARAVDSVFAFAASTTSGVNALKRQIPCNPNQ